MKSTVLICFAFLIINKVTSECKLGTIKVMAYRDMTLLTHTGDGQMVNINDLRGQYKATVFAQQKVPIFCKGLLQKLTNVQNIFVSFSEVNQIEDGIFKGTNIVSVEFNENALTTIKAGNFENMKELEDVTFSKNKITTIEEGAFRNLPKLVEVSITHEKIATVNPKWFVSCPLLTTVNLSFNKIKVVPSSAFNFFNQNLNPDINLEGNEIDKIEKGAFSSQYINILNLKHNRLSDINSNIFADLKSGKNLILIENGFKCVSENSINLFKLFKVVTMKKNPIEKSCDKKSIKKKVNNIEW